MHEIAMEGMRIPGINTKDQLISSLPSGFHISALLRLLCSVMATATEISSDEPMFCLFGLFRDRCLAFCNVSVLLWSCLTVL